MKKIASFLLIFLVIGIFFRPVALQHKLPIPSDSLVGLYHPFRDFFASDYPRGFPFKNFLITDPVRQQYEWRFLSNMLESKGLLPLWNPYNGLGMPLLANQQSASLYPLNLLFFLFPFATAWSFQVFLSSLLSAFFLYLYLKQLKLSSIASIFAGVAFAFSGFTIVWLEWNTVVQSFLWLPFILWIIEKLFVSKIWKGRLLYTLLASFGLVSSLFAGHLQTFFYVALVSASYFLLKLWQSKNTKKTLVIYFMIFLLLAIFLSLIQLIPTLQLISLSARTVDVDWHKAGWFIPFQHLLQFIIPDFFGNPTTLNYWGVWNYAELVGYIGIIPLIFSAIGGLFVRRRVVYFFLGVLVLSLLFSTDNPLATLPFVLHLPLLSTSQPTRLLSLIDFSLIIFTAFGIDYLKKISRKQAFTVLGLFSLIFFAVWMVLLFGAKIFPAIPLENLIIAKRNSVLPTGLFIIAFLLLTIMVLFRNRKVFLVGVLLLFLFTAYDGIHFAEKFTPFTSPQLLFPTTKTISFLQQHLHGYRYMTTDDRILPPNASAYYQIESLDVYDPLYLQRYGEFIAALQRKEPSINPPFGFNRIITPHVYSHPFINLLGVKYVLSLDTINDPSFKKVFAEGQTKIYENTHVLPRTFFVKRVISASSKQQSIEELYNMRDSLGANAVVEDLPVERLISQGVSKLQKQTANEVIIQTDNNGEGFLVLTDTYYPTWHAYIDGKEAHVYITDYTVRGVFVPQGKHTIAFRVSLF